MLSLSGAATAGEQKALQELASRERCQQPLCPGSVLGREGCQGAQEEELGMANSEGHLSNSSSAFPFLKTKMCLFTWPHWVLVVAFEIFGLPCSMGSLFSCSMWDVVP